MRQRTMAFVSAFVLLTVFTATATANSHTAPATTGTTTGTTVTAVPRAGVGAVELSSSPGIILLLVLVAALMAFVSLRQSSRA